MRIFLDTNILFSAALIPGSLPDKVYQAAVTGDKDLLEAGINNPKIITAAEFVALFG